MPIDVEADIRALDQEEFHALHRRILGIIFDIHNEFGRFLDEVLFKREIQARCEESNILPAHPELKIRVSHNGFHKDYFVDLCFCHGLPLEVKTAENLTAAHRAQSLNYVMLVGGQHGMLVNLRPNRVQHEFVSTRLTPAVRKQFKVVDHGWLSTDERTSFLKSNVLDLVQDWGAFLEIGLYREAITYFLGGEINVVKPVSVYSGRRLLGQQKVHLLSNDAAFALTAVTGDTQWQREHQTRFLTHTHLKALHWINFNHHQIEFATLTKT
jgi:GxxExxY protein